MDTMRICKGCQKALPADAPEGLCPACLAKVALEAEAATPTPTPTINISLLASEATPLGNLRYFGDYELLEEIARGGMGVVYKARQLSLNRLVAVKMILAGQLASEADVKRFRTEAEAAAQLQHPNIVAIHEVGEHQGQHYFSMDFVSGRSLAARMGDGPIPIGEAARLMKTIAEAVHFAHQRGIVHRDLKPANVLLDEFGQPRVTDFGLAKRLDRGEQLTASGAMLGTPDYMSPEQAAGRHDIIGAVGDVFSLGAMLYEMIAGRVPFRGSNLPETLSNILQNEPVSPSRLNPRVPPDLETICLKCLEKRPERRYTSAGELAKDLGRFLDHEAISAKPAGLSRRVSRWFVGHPQILAAVASGVLLALIWLVYGLWTENRILAWEKEHPTEMKPASDLLDRAGDSISWTISLLAVMFGLQKLLAKRIRQRVLTGRFVSPLILNPLGLAGVAGVTLSVCCGAAGIESWCWANHALPLAQNAAQAAVGRFGLKDLHDRVSLVALAANLLMAAGTAGLGAGVALKAFREHRFAFYHSAEEEQTALSQASLEQQKFAVKERRNRKYRGFSILVSSFVVLAHYKNTWATSQKLLFFVGEGSIYALACILALQYWRSSSRRHTLNRLLLVLTSAIAVVALILAPAVLKWQAIVLSSATGAAFGLFIRTTRKKQDALAAKPERSKGPV
jgi:serine/threonine protein kinase